MRKTSPPFDVLWTPTPETLDEPLRARKPRKILVADVFDQPFEFIAAVKGVQAATPQHTYIELTKRPKRMREFMQWVKVRIPENWDEPKVLADAMAAMGVETGWYKHASWPLPNVIHGYSASTQADLDAGMPDLMQVPSALHMLSAEPLLGDLDLGPALEGLDWVLVGGESGPGARPCDVAWIRAIVEQCKAAGTACFVKQLGAHAIYSHSRDVIVLRDPKGADPSEWPADLRVRQFPEVQA